jgi:large subunit ribosomal protein L17
MKIRKKFKKLGRKTSHRKSLLVNLSKSIIILKRIVTTVQKAKSVQKFIEPILTKIKKRHYSFKKNSIFSFSR